MIRTLGGKDFDFAMRAFKEWPLVEALFSFREIARDRAAHKYEFEALLFAITGKNAKGGDSAPEMPEVLREIADHGRT